MGLVIQYATPTLGCRNSAIFLNSLDLLILADSCHAEHLSLPYCSLLLVIAGASQRELGRKIKYLKTENEVLRSKLPERILRDAAATEPAG
jgi:putative transposase